MAKISGGAAKQQGRVPKMWSSVPDDILAPDFALPSQLKDIWHKSRAIRPERALALAVVEQSMEDLRKFRFADRRRQQRLYMEAYRWVMSNDREWPYSFVCLCDQLALEVEPMRRGLLGDAAPADCSAEPGLTLAKAPAPRHNGSDSRMHEQAA